MSFNRKVPGLLIMALFLGTASCSIESGGAADEPIGTADSAFTGYCGAFVVTSNGFGASTTCGVTGGLTWMGLSGVQGRLGNGNSSVLGWVNGNTAILNVDSGVTGDQVKATAWAMYPTSSPIPTGSCQSPAGNSPTSVTLTGPNGSGGYACFLYSVNSITVSNEWQAWTDKASIAYNANGTATLTCSGHSSASMACIPITHYLGSVTQGFSGSDVLNSDLGPVDWTNNKLCFLRGINGTFTNNSTSKGLIARIDAGIPNRWRFDTTAGVGGTVDCFY